MLTDCDLVFSKPGGLTVAEALSLGKPLVLLTKGAGQESANAEYVINSRVGYLADRAEKLTEFINSIEKQPEITLDQFNKINTLFKESAKNIAQLIINFS